MQPDRLVLHPAMLRRQDRIFRAAMREKHRTSVEAIRVIRGLPPRPTWLDEDPPTFAFSDWHHARRPFDWAHDPADLPVEPPAPTPFPEQARLRLYLHPPAAVVQR